MFRNSVTDMEQRLGTIVCKAFDDCSNCESAFKVGNVKGATCSSINNVSSL